MANVERATSEPFRHTIRAGNPQDTIKIMLATDNHIGYLERDPIRGQDAINTFEEILQLAIKHDVDFILLAGDLFHENRPSRDCIYRVIALLREYTFGDKPISVELLSDPEEGKAPGFSFPAINYEDGNFNVSVPVFSIHGNHDDPQGTGPEGALSALDLLSVTGVINYIGKSDLEPNDNDNNSTGLAIKPVLLRKGRTRLGMYGIGNVKDTRMHYELRSNRVRMFMPSDKDDWFNILLVHQNRIKHGAQQSVPEGMFDDSINLVVWGHEHDCRIEPEPVAGKGYFITQPGSSVATSLADGESLQKHVALVEVQGKEFQLTPIALRTVRPFVMEEVVLLELESEGKIDITKPMEITKYLKSRVNALIDKANADWDERNTAAVAVGEKELSRMLPLVRLKVDTTGVSGMSNPVRFGQEFAGRLANPRDVLLFHRAKKSATRAGKVFTDEPELSIDDPALSAREKLEKVRVETLVKEYLAAQELQLLGENGMSDAIQTFVDKDDIHSISRFVAKSLSSLQKGVGATEIDEEELEERLMKAKEQAEVEYAQRKLEGKTSKKGKGKQVESDRESVDSMKMDIDTDESDFEEPAPKKLKAPAKKAPAVKAKGPAKGKGRTRRVVSSAEFVLFKPFNYAEEFIEEEAPLPKKSNRAAVLSATASKKATAKKRPESKQTTLRATTSRATSGRAAANKAKGKMADVV
ncbi:Metallo-dependent phosphatase-like protein [Hysterangium stoloniferum]|nr:Metallo-dependent phosphatase-like protein [Hysterangium stoloniferum]